MSQTDVINELRRENKALAELMKSIVPQAFSSNEIMGSSDLGAIDEWKMARIPAPIIPALIYFRHRGENDNVRFYREFYDLILRASHSINGAGLKMLTDIAIGMSGGGSRRRIVQKPGWVGRNISKRSWRASAEADNAEIAE